jgi:ferredoxin--NADP+ reductase
MTHVIAGGCINDGSCVSVCPVDAIWPRPGDAAFLSSEQLYIDPSVCIDCGACLSECPVEAIRAESDLPAGLEMYSELNAAYFAPTGAAAETEVATAPPRALRPPKGEAQGLRVAIIGAGPSGCFLAESLRGLTGVEIALFDRLPTPFGLVRAGVAPDHPKTKQATRMLERILRQKNVTCYFGVEIGVDITLDELRRRHHAVVFAGGVEGGRALGVPGEDLPGVVTAAEIVSWYNGHPDFTDQVIDLSGTSAVIIGNGNVALDIARLLTVDPESLAETDIADHALDALRTSRLETVHVVGRRGPHDAGFTASEYLRFEHDVARVETVAADFTRTAAPTDTRPRSVSSGFKARQAMRERPQPGGEGRTAVFRYGLTPVVISGDRAVEAVEFRHTGTDTVERVPASVVITAIGFTTAHLPGLAINAAGNALLNTDGRIVGADGEPEAGLYCVGWAKRGPSGSIGTNRECSIETAGLIVEDFRKGLLPPVVVAADDQGFIRSRQPNVIDRLAWNRVDDAEKRAGRSAGRSRSKFFTIDDMLFAARNPSNQ